jgi:CheY-like chemotaxis protein
VESGQKILIIDDEEVVLDSCSEILAGSDYEVSTATDGVKGLKLVEERHLRVRGPGEDT